MSMSGMMAAKKPAKEIHIPAEIDWNMLDKSRFFFLGAALFSGVSAALYPTIVLKTRQQVSPTQISCTNLSMAIARFEGFRGFYRGFGTSLLGTIPARALYMGALEVTKSTVGKASIKFGFSDTSAMALANAAAGMSSAMAAQMVWTPIDVISQRLMVQGNVNTRFPAAVVSCKYSNGFDAFRKILCTDGPRGFYRGFGISLLTYAPSNAVWWASYSLAQRSIWKCLEDYLDQKQEKGLRSSSMAMVSIQGVSAAMASGVSAMITMPLDTIKTRLQVLDREENGKRRPLTMLQTVKSLVKEGGCLPATED